MTDDDLMTRALKFYRRLRRTEQPVRDSCVIEWAADKKSAMVTLNNINGVLARFK